MIKRMEVKGQYIGATRVKAETKRQDRRRTRANEGAEDEG
jgi:hypothetical protein